MYSATVNRMPSRASIVIPAFNEETRIRGLLDTLSDPSIAGLYDVYVVCNGCTDRTRQVAEEYFGVTVVDIGEAGKYLALNEGDRLAGDIYPRLYCDADIRLSPASITALVDAMTIEEVVVAAPEVHYSVEGSTWMINMFYRGAGNSVIAGWNKGLLAGRGLYGTSRAARRRFGPFPALYADDLFFDSQYGASEKLILPEVIVEAWVPASVRQLIIGGVRVEEGNRQYQTTEKVDAGNSDHATVHRDRFERSVGERIKSHWKARQDLHFGDVVPLLVYVSIRTATYLTFIFKRMQGRKIRWR